MVPMITERALSISSAMLCVPEPAMPAPAHETVVAVLQDAVRHIVEPIRSVGVTSMETKLSPETVIDDPLEVGKLGGDASVRTGPSYENELKKVLPTAWTVMPVT
jgi:hypothetical protein